MFISLIIISLASMLHGLTGMGFPLIATPALATSLPLPQAIALLAIPTFILNALVVFKKETNKEISQEANKETANHTTNTALLKRYWLLALMSVIGSIVGVKLLFILPLAYLNLIMAVVILYYATQGLLALYHIIKPIHVPTGKLGMASFGFLSGLIGGATNAMSPILLMYLLSKTQDKSEIAKASNLCYLLAKIVQIILLWHEFAKFDKQAWGLLALIVVLSMTGLGFGTQLRHRISQNLFKQLIYIILLIIGIKVGWSGLTAL